MSNGYTVYASKQYVSDNFALKSDLEKIDLTPVYNEINTHNTSTESHADIRNLISALSTKVSDFLDVDDTTTDQLSEVLDLIKDNKDIIDSITSNKVNVSDIVNSLTSEDANKVLSAKQGKVLKDLIDALTLALDDKANKIHEHDAAYDKIGSANTALSSAKSYTDEQIETLDDKFALKSDLDNIDLSDYETKGDAESKLQEAKNYSDTKLEEAKDYSDDKLEEAKDYSDNNLEIAKTFSGIDITQEEYDALPEEEKLNGTYYITDAAATLDIEASAVEYDNTVSQLVASNVQAAIDELKYQIDNKASDGDYATIEYVDNNFALKSDLENIDLSEYETKVDAGNKLTEAKAYTDEKISTIDLTPYETVENSDSKLAEAKSYSDTNLKSAKTYSDKNFTTLKSYVDGLNDTTSQAITAANEAIAQQSRIEFVIWEEND